MVLVVKNPPANAGDIRDAGSIPGWGRSPGGGHGNPLQYPRLENPHRQRSLAGYSPWVHIELDTSEAPQHAHAHKPETNALICVPSQEKAAFRELIAQLELDPKCRGLPLSSFLILPFQRITRLKLLVQVPDSLPLHPPTHTSAAALFLRSVQVSAGSLRSPCAPQILIKLLLCARQWETRPLLPESQILVGREIHTQPGSGHG